MFASEGMHAVSACLTASHQTQCCADDFHHLLLPEAVRDDPKVVGARYIHDVVVKQLLTCGPPNVAWNITGNCMAMAWLDIANMPFSGYSLFSGNTIINLPVRW